MGIGKVGTGSGGEQAVGSLSRRKDSIHSIKASLRSRMRKVELQKSYLSL